MKLYSPKDVDQVAGVRCRQSRLRGVLVGLIVCAGFIGAVFLFRHVGAPAPVRIGGVILAALVVVLVLADMVARFRSVNWQVWIRPDGLWINLRSYQNRHLPDAATVLHLPYEEIACAHRHLETWTTPVWDRTVGVGVNQWKAGTVGGYRSTEYKVESLELSLASGDTQGITQALANERHRPAGLKSLQQAVSVPSPGAVRIAWRGNGNDVVPGLGRVLDELGPYVKLGDPTRTDRPYWGRLSEAELDDLLAHLIRSGDRLAVIDLLMLRRGCSPTEAEKLVQELDARV
jgi:hypothetical protein